MTALRVARYVLLVGIAVWLAALALGGWGVIDPSGAMLIAFIATLGIFASSLVAVAIQVVLVLRERRQKADAR